MNNFPTMTAAQHAALIWRCEEVIRNCENAMYAEAMNEAEEMDLRITQIALAALTAEPVHQFIVNNPDNDGYVEWADCNTDYFSKEPRDMRRVLYTAPPVPVLRVQELTVWYGAMPETNGKSNWTAILHRKGECISTGITIDRSEYPDRVRYEADRMRYLIGELLEKPDILAYDANKYSGYKKPTPPEASNEQ